MKVNKEQIKNKKKFIYLILIVSILAGLGLTGNLNFATLYGGQQNNDDTYYATINVDNTGKGQLVGYQQLITISHETAMQDDFDDIVFTETDGTIISHDKLSFTSGIAANFYISLNCDADSTKQIYMYYGNSAMTDQSNPSNVYEFYDDFDDNNYDGWTVTNIGASVSNGILNLEKDGFIIYPYTLKSNEILHTRFKQNTNQVSTHDYISVGVLTSYQDLNNYHKSWITDNNKYGTQERYSASWSSEFYVNSPNDVQQNVWYDMEVLRTDNTILIQKDNEDFQSVNTFAPYHEYGNIGFMSAGEVGEYDYVYVRQYVASEPTITVGEGSLVPITFPSEYDTIINTKTYTGTSASNNVVLEHKALPISSVESSITYNEVGNTKTRPITITNTGSSLTNFQYEFTDRTLPAYASSYAKLHYYTDLACIDEIPQYRDLSDESEVIIKVDLSDGDTTIYEKSEYVDATINETNVFDSYTKYPTDYTGISFNTFGITNGDAESLTGWTNSGGSLTSSYKQQGSNSIQVQAIDGDTAGKYISQSVTVPNMDNVYLHFWINSYKPEPWGYKANCQIDGTQLVYLSSGLSDGSTNTNGVWTEYYEDVSAYAGQTVTLKFWAAAWTTASDNGGGIRVDDVYFTNSDGGSLYGEKTTGNIQSHSYGTVIEGNDFIITSGSISDSETAVISTPTSLNVIIDEMSTETTIITGCADFDYSASLIWNEGMEFTKSLNNTTFIATGTYTPLEATTSSLITCKHTIDTSTYDTEITAIVDDIEQTASITADQISFTVTNLDVSEHTIAIQANLTILTTQSSSSGGGSGGGSVSVPTITEETTDESNTDTEIINTISEQMDKEEVDDLINDNFQSIMILILFVVVGFLSYAFYKGRK